LEESKINNASRIVFSTGPTHNSKIRASKIEFRRLNVLLLMSALIIKLKKKLTLSIDCLQE